MFKHIAERFKPSKHQFAGKIRLHYGPILEMPGCEAMTFFMSPRLEWDGPLNGAVLARAGNGLDDYILTHVDHPKPGQVFALPAFDAGFKGLFMAVVDEWDGGVDFNDRDLVRCYCDAVIKAQEAGIKTIAFPAMGKDKRDFPHIRFARLALQGILEGLDERMDSVIIACVDKRMINTYQDRLDKLTGHKAVARG
jgi:O-acetyl-ADP-ribose deacetylase (regulator of RNase III)